MVFRRTVWLVAAVLLAGCAVPTATPSSKPSGSSAPLVTPSPVAPPTDLVRSAMPAGDGGPMLWAAPLTLAADGGEEVHQRYGFVDVHGALVIPQRYDSFTYCPDAAGRAAFLIVQAARRNAEVYDLAGKLLARTPTATAECGGVQHVIISNVRNSEIGDYDSGLLDLRSGAVALPITKNRHLEVIDANTVNVSDPGGEFFLDLTTGRHTRHQGWLAGPISSQTAVLVASPRREDYGVTPGVVGFVNRAGAWALPPKYAEATGFDSGFALVREGRQYAFVNAAFQQVGGLWDDATTTIYGQRANSVLGYLVVRGGKKGLLGPDLKEVLAPEEASIDCRWSASGACSVIAANGGAAMVVMPGGLVTPMPAGFTEALSPSFLSDHDEAADGVTRVYAVESGRTIVLDSPRSCDAVGLAWLACQAGAGMTPPVVLNAEGNITSFASAAAVDDPSPSEEPAYFWVTSGRYEGFVDAAGGWRYRQSRFTQLED